MSFFCAGSFFVVGGFVFLVSPDPDLDPAPVLASTPVPDPDPEEAAVAKDDMPKTFSLLSGESPQVERDNCASV